MTMSDENVRPEIQALVARGNVTSAEVAALRGNSWEWEALVPVMTDEAFVERILHVLSNCSRTERRPFASYDEAVKGLWAPELIRRFKKLVSDHLIMLNVPNDTGAVFDELVAANNAIYGLNCRVAELKQKLEISGRVVSEYAARSVTPGENLRMSDPRFGSPEHMKARWKSAGIQGPFSVEPFPSYLPSRHFVRECSGARQVVAECLTSEIANAVMDALDAYEGGKNG